LVISLSPLIPCLDTQDKALYLTPPSGEQGDYTGGMYARNTHHHNGKHARVDNENEADAMMMLDGDDHC
jgi:glycine cleavage system protein P-like pyridoxal-binding family